MPESAFDFDALARQFGGSVETDEPETVDYDALAQQFGAAEVPLLTLPEIPRITPGPIPEPSDDPDEQRFRAWYAAVAPRHGLAADPDSQPYDYRAAYRAGVRGPDRTGHWPSDYKRDDHPNLVVGGFNTKTGQRVPGTPRAKDAAELERLGWDPETAKTLAATPEPVLQRARTGQLYQTPPRGTSPLDIPGEGIRQIARASKTLLTEPLGKPPAPTPGSGVPLVRSRTGALYTQAQEIDPKELNAFSDLIEGSYKAMSVALPAAALTHPVVLAITLGTAEGAALAAEQAAKAAGLSQEAQRLAGNTASLVAVSAGGGEIVRRWGRQKIAQAADASRTAREAREAAREQARTIQPEPTDIPVRPERTLIPERPLEPEIGRPSPPPEPHAPADRLDALAKQNGGTAGPGPEYAPVTAPPVEPTPTPPSDIVAIIQDKLAKGEPLGSLERRQNFAERQRVEAERRRADVKMPGQQLDEIDARLGRIKETTERFGDRLDQVRRSALSTFPTERLIEIIRETDPRTNPDRVRALLEELRDRGITREHLEGREPIPGFDTSQAVPLKDIADIARAAKEEVVAGLAKPVGAGSTQTKTLPALTAGAPPVEGADLDVLAAEHGGTAEAFPDTALAERPQLALKVEGVEAVRAVASFEEAARLVDQLRDQHEQETGEGVSSFPRTTVIDTKTGKTVANISYNGRVWDAENPTRELVERHDGRGYGKPPLAGTQGGPSATPVGQQPAGDRPQPVRTGPQRDQAPVETAGGDRALERPAPPVEGAPATQEAAAVAPAPRATPIVTIRKATEGGFRVAWTEPATKERQTLVVAEKTIADRVRAAVRRGIRGDALQEIAFPPPPPPAYKALPVRERRELRGILAELEDLGFTPGKQLVDERTGRDVGYSYRAPGSPVLHDIAQGLETVTRPQIARAIRAYMNGRKPSQWAIRALEVARQRLAGDPRVSMRMLEPPDEPSEIVVPRNPNLTGEAKEVEERVASAVEADPEGFIARYRERFTDPKTGTLTVSADHTKELFPEYAASDEARTRLTTAVQNTASKLSRAVFRARLAELAAEGKKGTVLLTGGGTGSGKTTSVATVFPDLQRDADIIYDSTLSHPRGAREDIAAAFNAGQEVGIVFVYRDPIEAFKGVLKRAMEEGGRIVTVIAHARTHVRAPRTIAELADEYRNENRVSFVFLDNTGPEGGAAPTTLEAIQEKAYTDEDDLRRQLTAVLEEQHRSGAISDAVYDATRKGLPRESADRQDSGTLQRPESGRPDSEAVAGDSGREEPDAGIPPAQETVDTLDTGEVQPRLPGDTGSVRDREVATPEFDVPFALTAETSKAPDAVERDLFAAPPEAEPEPKPKQADREPWQMTRAEWMAQRPAGTSPGMHSWHVKKALEAGEPVPAEVLADYPDLKPSEAQPSAREALIERIVAAARDPEPEIVPSIRWKGSDGNWYKPQGVPQGVTLTDAKRIDGYVIRTPEGTTAGTLAPTKEAKREQIRAAQEKKSAEFREHLRGLSDAALEQKAEYWLTDQRPMTLSRVDDLLARLQDGQVEARELRVGFQQVLDNRTNLTKELLAQKKETLLKRMGGFKAERYKHEKKDAVVAAAFNDILSGFVLEDSISYGLGKDSLEKAVRARVERYTEQDIAAYKARVAEARTERDKRLKGYKKALTNPETLEEFDTFVRFRKGGEGALTPEQRATYDELRAAAGRERRTEAQQRTATVEAAGEQVETTLVETKHTQKGYALFVIQLASRVSREDYTRLNTAARKLGGWYSSFNKGGAVPGFQFKTREAAEAFQKLATGGDTAAVQEAVVERRATKRETRKNAAAERLADMAERMEEAANEKLSADRLVNTARRAQMAASAEGQARTDLAMAKTLRNLADAIESGQATHLDGIRTKVQVETLNKLAEQAKYETLRKQYPEYRDFEKHKDRAVEAGDVDAVAYPSVTATSADLLSNARYLREAGGKGVAIRLEALAKRTSGEQHIDVPWDIVASAVAVADENPKTAMLPWYWANRLGEKRRLETAGIPDLPTLRAALREFIQHRGEKPKADRVKELERALAGTKDVGIDFFPTPEPLALRMAEALDVQKGMRVLEPSAGKGNLADAVRTVQPEAEVRVVELSSTLREILREKGYPILAPDFMDLEVSPVFDRVIMNPPFSQGRDATHVQRAYDLLKPGGRLVAITGEGIFFREDAKSREFRAWFESVGGQSEKLEGAFTDRREVKTTGVASRMLIIDKPGEPIPKTDEQRPDAGGTEAFGFVDPFTAGIVMARRLWRAKQGKAKAAQSPLAASSLAEVEQRWQEAKGIQSPGVRQKVAEAWDAVKKITRHFPEINPSRSPMEAVAQELLLEQERAPKWAQLVAHDRIAEIVKGLAANEADLLTRALALPDLLKDLEAGLYEGKDLPFGYTTRQQIEQDLARVNAAVEGNPKVNAALDKRARFVQRLTQDLVDAELLPASVLDDPRYYHRQVMAYMSAQEQARVGVGKGREVRQRKRGFQRGRVGGSDFNTRYVEAEFEWVAQALTELKTKATLEELKALADQTATLKRQARALNLERLGEKVAAMAASGTLQIEATRQPDLFGEDLDGTALAEAVLKPYHQQIAYSIEELLNALVDGNYQVSERFEEAVEELKDGWTEYQAEIADLDKDERRAHPPFDSNHPQWWPLLADLVQHKTEAGKWAAGIFKAIRAREDFIKDTLGRDYLDRKDPEDLLTLAPDDYVTWQPKEGNHFFKVQSVDARVLERVIAGDRTLSDEDKRAVMAMGGPRETWIVPQWLADTLDHFGATPQAQGPLGAIDRLWSAAIATWKQQMLLFPGRVVRYNVNNLSGDTDAALAYAPGIFKHLPEAASFLHRSLFGTPSAADTARMERLTELGVIDAGLTAHEIPDVNTLPGFRRLAESDPQSFMAWLVSLGPKYYEHARKITQYRENLLRVAAYDYMLAHGPTRAYAASNPARVDALRAEAGTREGKERLAALLARDLIGDYQAVSAFTQFMRTRTLPFFSFQEINFKRYLRLFQNAAREGKTGRERAAQGARAAAGAAGRAGLKWGIRFALANAFMVSVVLWNKLFFPDEDEELRRRGREQLHLILGRHEDGSIRSVRIEGAFADFLEWFGLGQYLADAEALIDADISVGEKLTEMAQAAPNKIIQLWEPFTKQLFEQIAGRKTFPNAFRPSPIRDRGEHLAGIAALDRLYARVTGKPVPPGNPVSRLLFYRTDPGEAAYFDVKAQVGKWQEANGKERFIGDPTARSNALYYWKRAVQWGDDAAAAKWRQEYFDLGGTKRGLRQSVKRSAPLGALSARDQRKFRQQLRPEDRKMLEMAEAWYRRLYRNAQRPAVGQ